MKSIPLSHLLEHAIASDMGPIGDVTSNALIPENHTIEAIFVMKDKWGTISGISVVKEVFSIIDPRIHVAFNVHDGDQIKKREHIAVVNGPARGILQGERVALEFLRRLSGIATLTHEYVEVAKGTGVTILDTRKTYPGFGDLEKKAVRDGGGTNHRANLSEMGLIKNNHIDLLRGDIALSVSLFRKKYPAIRVEVEVRNHRALEAALHSSPDRILLDNLLQHEIRDAVAIRNTFAKKNGKRIPLEVSGSMTLPKVRAIAKTGVDYISVGALTHSAPPVDISLHVLRGKV